MVGATPTPTPKPLPVQAPGWEEVTVHILCLEVEQSYPQIEEEFSQPIVEAAGRILARVGLQVVAEGAPCEATLTLTLIGRALGATYIPGGYCYTGAEVSGQVTFTVPDRESLTMPVEGQVPTPDNVSDCPGEPSGAPFGRVWPEAVLDGLADLWGHQVYVQALGDEHFGVEAAAGRALEEIGPEAVPALIQALEDKDGDVREAAAEALRSIGPEAVEAVPVLIQALEDKEYLVRMKAWSALRAITGQDFGEDADRWQEWWEEQQQ